MADLKITLKRSLIGYDNRQRLTARALGLGKLGSSVTQQDSSSVRGMIRKLAHAVTVEQDGTIISAPAPRLGHKHLYGPAHGPVGVKRK